MNKSTHTGSLQSGSVFRLYMGGSAIVTWFLAVTEPRSLSGLAAVAGDGAGALLIWCLLAVGAATIVDAVVNDFLPERFCWQVAVRQRHFTLSAMAFCYVAQLYVAYTHFRSTGLLIYYLWNAVFIVFISFVDAHQRSRDATCVVICG